MKTPIIGAFFDHIEHSQATHLPKFILLRQRTFFIGFGGISANKATACPFSEIRQSSIYITELFCEGG
jgi:hypothetical protein